MLFYYIIKKKKELHDFSRKLVAIKTIVSTKMVNSIAKKEGCSVVEVLTGFKNIANEIAKMEKEGNLSGYVFGFEESNGYLCGTYARDKDAVSAAVLICEVASYFKRSNLSLIDAISKLSEKYGYYKEKTLSFDFGFGEKGVKKISSVISCFKNFSAEEVGGLRVNSCLPHPESCGVIAMSLEDENEVIIRPSGTEPKLKAYVLAHDCSEKLVSERLSCLCEQTEKMVKEFSEV